MARRRSLAPLALIACAACRFGFDAPGAGRDAAGMSIDAAPDVLVVTPLGRAKANGAGLTGGMCAVVDDGSLWCWGDLRTNAVPLVSTEPFTLPVQIGTATDWRTVALGGNHGCGIREPGTLWCWGRNQFGEVGDGTTLLVATPTQIGSTATWADVAAGFNTTCARTTAGVLSCWGRNDYGQLGDNSTTSKSSPQTVGGLPAIVQVSVGDLHVCALDAASTLHCWGYNVTGCIGNGTTSEAHVPITLAGTWKSVDARIENTLAIASDGTLRGWGNAVGSSPVVLDGRTDWQQVHATLYGGCALRAGGELWCKGGGSFVTGPNIDNNPTLTQIAAGSQFDTVSVAISVACANRDGQLECIGSGAAGELGDVAARYEHSPHLLVGRWSALTGGTFATCGADAAGVAYCWGATTALAAQARPQVPALVVLPALSAIAHNGSTGIATATTGELWYWGVHVTDAGGTDVVSPPAVRDSGAWSTAIAVGYNSLAAIRTDQSLWSWGANANGEVGDGTTMPRGSPTQIGTGYLAVSVGNAYACAIRTDATLRCWGSNGFGQLGDSTTTPRLVPSISAAGAWSRASAGEGGTLAIRSDGTLWAWGSNGLGRLGLGGSAGASTPTQVGAATWLEISTRVATSCGIRTDHTLWCWGDNTDGQAAAAIGPSPLTPQQIGSDVDWVDVTVGGSHACARKLDGTAACWGRNGFGERGDGLAWRASYGPVARP